MKTLALICMVVLALLVGCVPAQEGTSKEISYVPIDQIVVEDGQVSDDTPLLDESDSDDLVSETESQPDEEVVEDTLDETPISDSSEVDAESEAEANAPEADAQEAAQEIVIIVEETQLVRVRPVAADPDEDQLIFTYTTPLNAGGEWQTTYGDAGQYTVTVTASDGELTATKDALVVVNKKEESPIIDLASPEQIQQTLLENTDIAFRIEASDLNKDRLAYSWKLDGSEVSDSQSYTYRADYFSAGAHTLKVEVSDGTSTTSLLWSITVSNVDRAPVLAPIPDITVRETETVKIAPQASDPDGDALSFVISDPVGDDGVWQTTYDDSGVFAVKVAVSDGELTDNQDIKITVINVNRPPVIENIIQVR